PPAHHGDHGAHAVDDGETGQKRPHLVPDDGLQGRTQRLPEHQATRGRWRSVATRPSRKGMVREAYSAISATWVTMMMVIPSPSLSSVSSLMISWLRAVSRLPVGSSASTSAGRVT